MLKLKPHHRPLVAHRVLSFTCFLACFVAFVLYLLVALSVPIIKGVFLLTVKAIVTNQPETSTATELRFGVWGVCAYSALDQPSLIANGGECYGPRLGYTVPPLLLSLIGIYTPLVTIVLKALLVLLILHPIIAGLSLLSFIFSLFLASHPFSIFALLITTVTALLSSVVFATDLTLVVVARNKVADLTQLNFAVHFGNGIWMMLVGVVLTWLAVILLSARACYCCGVRRKDPEPWYSDDGPTNNELIETDETVENENKDGRPDLSTREGSPPPETIASSLFTHTGTNTTNAMTEKPPSHQRGLSQRHSRDQPSSESDQARFSRRQDALARVLS